MRKWTLFFTTSFLCHNLFLCSSSFVKQDIKCSLPIHYFWTENVFWSWSKDWKISCCLKSFFEYCQKRDLGISKLLISISNERWSYYLWKTSYFMSAKYVLYRQVLTTYMLIRLIQFFRLLRTLVRFSRYYHRINSKDDNDSWSIER